MGVRLAQVFLQAANAETAPGTVAWSHSLTTGLSGVESLKEYNIHIEKDNFTSHSTGWLL